MGLKRIEISRNQQIIQFPKRYLERSGHCSLKPLGLCASGILSIAIAVSPVQAEEKLSIFDDSTVSFKAFESSTAESNPVPRQESIHPAHTLKQAASLLPRSSDERSIEAGNFSPVKPTFSLHSIAQADAPPSQPAESNPVEAQPSEVSPPPTAEPATNETANKPASDPWEFSVQPYFFVPLSVQLDGTAAGRSASIDLGLGEILSFDRAFDAGLRLEARKNRWGILFDGLYVFAKNSGNLGVTFPAGSLARFGVNFPVRASADASLSVRQGVIDLAAAYRVVDTSLRSSTELSNRYPRLVVDPILGLRINIVSQELEVDDIRLNNVSIGNLPLPISISVDQDFSFSRTFVEPLIGARIGLELSDRWTLGIRGDVSGFGINADRNLTWNVLASTQYNLSPTTSLQLGYRFNRFDYEDGSGLRRARVNLRQNGLLLGITFRF